MFENFWNVALYQPVFNALIFIYQTIAGGNMGWAIVWLTVALRLLLLPLNIVSERNSIKRETAAVEAAKAIEAFKNDRIAQSEATRQVMRKYKISPWAKVAMLFIQVLVLILLYQVFIHGITGERLAKSLYSTVEMPGAINVDFYGFDIGARHDSLWAGIATLYLFISIYIEYRKSKGKHKPDLLYWLGFPVFMFLALWYLPMVKSLFILTTMIFSDTITIIRKVIFSGAKKEDSHGH